MDQDEAMFGAEPKPKKKRCISWKLLSFGVVGSLFAVSNNRSWLDGKPGLTQGQAEEITAARKSEACIEAVGAAKGTGRLVGTSIGAAAAPTLSTIPFVGWVAAGWVAMFGGNQGADIGGNMAEDMSKDC